MSRRRKSIYKKKKKSVNEKSFIHSLMREIHRNYYVINHIILYKIFRNFLNYIKTHPSIIRFIDKIFINFNCLEFR